MEDYFIEPYCKQPNYLISRTQAARILGNKDYRLADKLIKQKLLNTYSIPGSQKVLLKYHEVMNLPKKKEN